jgi:hypothetical protein
MKVAIKIEQNSTKLGLSLALLCPSFFLDFNQLFFFGLAQAQSQFGILF